MVVQAFGILPLLELPFHRTPSAPPCFCGIKEGPRHRHPCRLTAENAIGRVPVDDSGDGRFDEVVPPATLRSAGSRLIHPRSPSMIPTPLARRTATTHGAWHVEQSYMPARGSR